MPEGHTIHRLARALNTAFGASRLQLASPQGRFATEAAELNGWVFQGSEAAGKHLFMGFSPEADAPAQHFVHIHLGLYGSWSFAGDSSFHQLSAIGAPRRALAESQGAAVATDPDWWRKIVPGVNVRLRMIGEHGIADLTGPNQCELIGEEEKTAVIQRLGPDPLREDAQIADFVARVKKSKQSIGQLLMDQKVVAGIGNIYRAELLFRAKLDPFVPGNELGEPLIRDLWKDLVPLISYGEKTGRIVTTQPEHRKIHAEINERMVPVYQNSDGAANAVPREDSFYVYHRQNIPCRICNTPIREADMAGRKLYWCPKCQTKRSRRSGWIDKHPAEAWA